MKNQFVLAFNEVLEEKQLPKEVILEASEAAMVSAFRRAVAAVSLGAGPISTFTKVVFPLSRVAFLSTATFFFMRAMTTISAVIFLISATIKLAAIEIIFLDVDGRTASANAMCTVL